MYSPGRCGESHLGGGRSFRWLRSEKLKANDERLLRASGPSNSESAETHTQQTLGIDTRAVEVGGGQSERAESPSSAPYPVLSCPVRSWWLHSSRPGTEARPSTGPGTPRRSVSRCYGRLLHTICSMFLIYSQNDEDEAPVRAEMAAVEGSGRPPSRSCCRRSESRSGDVKAVRG